MKNYIPILILLICLVSCHGIQIPEQPEGGAELLQVDSLFPMPVTKGLWDTLAIDRHQWINVADYDHQNHKWIINNNPDRLSFSFDNERHNYKSRGTCRFNEDVGTYAWCVRFATDNYYVSELYFKQLRPSWRILTAIKDKYFFLTDGDMTMCFSYTHQVDTGRIFILDPTDQGQDVPVTDGAPGKLYINE